MSRGAAHSPAIPQDELLRPWGAAGGQEAGCGGSSLGVCWWGWGQAAGRTGSPGRVGPEPVAGQGQDGPPAAPVCRQHRGVEHLGMRTWCWLRWLGLCRGGHRSHPWPSPHNHLSRTWAVSMLLAWGPARPTSHRPNCGQPSLACLSLGPLTRAGRVPCLCWILLGVWSFPGQHHCAQALVTSGQEPVPVSAPNSAWAVGGGAGPHTRPPCLTSRQPSDKLPPLRAAPPRPAPSAEAAVQRQPPALAPLSQ